MVRRAGEGRAVAIPEQHRFGGALGRIGSD
jgi:hypothetical protein